MASKQYNKEYYQRNKAQKLEAAREYYLKNAESKKEYGRKRQCYNYANQAPTSNPGYVYLICLTINDVDYYKIGHTNNLSKRFRDFATFSPIGFDVIATAYVEDRRNMEARLKWEYYDKKHNGEWFLLNEDDIQTFRNLTMGLVNGKEWV